MVLDRLRNIYESYTVQKTPEVEFGGEEELVSYLETLDFIASGMEAMVFLHQDRTNVVRLDIYSLGRETILALIEKLKKKDENSAKVGYFNDLLAILSGGDGVYVHLRDSADQRLRKTAQKYNDLFKKKPDYSIPCRALLTVNKKAVALVLPFIDGESMTEQEAEAFDRENNFDTRDTNPENYRKNVTTWKNSRVRLDP